MCSSRVWSVRANCKQGCVREVLRCGRKTEKNKIKINKYRDKIVTPSGDQKAPKRYIFLRKCSVTSNLRDYHTSRRANVQNIQHLQFEATSHGFDACVRAMSCAGISPGDTARVPDEVKAADEDVVDVFR